MRRLAAVALAVAVAAAAPAPRRALELRTTLRGDPLVLRSAPWTAGAVSSLRFRGMEYVNADDHGRMLQGAIFFDGLGECHNPTQAGAARDRPGRATTSRLLSASTAGGAWAVETQMAYYRRPGERCEPPELPPQRAVNRTRLSEVVYQQAQRLDDRAVETRIRYRVGWARRSAVVEPLTIYTPPSFSVLHLRRPDGSLELASGPVGEQASPLILSTPDGAHAVAFYAPPAAAPPAYSGLFYGVTSKLNVVVRPRGPYAAGAHDYRVVWTVGTREEVRATLDALVGDRGGRT